MLPVISKFILTRRLETMQKACQAGDMSKLDRVIDNTLKMITNRQGSEVHELTLKGYVKHIEMVQLLSYFELVAVATSHLALAMDLIVRNLATMTPTYIFMNRLDKLPCVSEQQDDLGTLAMLPNDMLLYISHLLRQS